MTIKQCLINSCVLAKNFIYNSKNVVILGRPSGVTQSSSDIIAYCNNHPATPLQTFSSYQLNYSYTLKPFTFETIFNSFI